MTIAEKLAQIKKLVFDTAMAQPAPKQQPAKGAKQYKLQDGTPVSITQLATGGDVLINGSPAKAGDYVLQDGTQLTIDESSKITAVTPPADDAKPQPKDAPGDDGANSDAAEDDAVTAKALKQQLTQHQQAFEAYKAATDKKLADHAQQMDKHKDALQQMFEVVQKIAKTPTGEAPQPAKAKFSFSKVNDRKEMMNRYLHAMDELKNSK